MADGITRRTFLGSAAMIGASSALGLDNSTNRSSATEGSLPARKSSFDESWMFYKGDPVGAHLPDYRSGDWTSVDLPHDWSIDGPTARMNLAAVRVGMCPPVSHGTANRFSFQSLASDESAFNSTGSISEARSGSMDALLACDPTDTSRSHTI